MLSALVEKGVPAIWFAFVSVDACTDDALPVIAGGGVPEICVCVVHSALAQPTQTVRRRVLEVLGTCLGVGCTESWVVFRRP